MGGLREVGHAWEWTWTDRRHAACSWTVSACPTARWLIWDPFPGSQLLAVRLCPRFNLSRGEMGVGEAAAREGGELERVAVLVEQLAALLGGEAPVTAALGVSQRQVARWRRREQRPSLQRTELLEELRRVVVAAGEVWGDPVVVFDWLTGSNAHLGGATPVAVLGTRGPAEVLECLAEEAAGAYA